MGNLIKDRAGERFPANLPVRFFFGNTFCSGNISNISEEGLCVDTDICFPQGSIIDLIVLLKEKTLTITVAVNWLRDNKKGRYFTTMGTEVLDRTAEFSEIVTSAKKKPV